MGKPASNPENVTGAEDAPLSSITPFNVGESVPAGSVSNPENVPVPGQASPNCVISTGKAGVNSSVPVLPPAGTISSRMVTPNVDSPAISPETVSVTVEPGGIDKLLTDNEAPCATVATITHGANKRRIRL